MRYSNILLIVTKKVSEKKLTVTHMGDVASGPATYVLNVPALSPTGLVYKGMQRVAWAENVFCATRCYQSRGCRERMAAKCYSLGESQINTSNCILVFMLRVH